MGNVRTFDPFASENIEHPVPGLVALGHWCIYVPLGESFRNDPTDIAVFLAIFSNTKKLLNGLPGSKICFAVVRKSHFCEKIDNFSTNGSFLISSFSSIHEYVLEFFSIPPKIRPIHANPP